MTTQEQMAKTLKRTGIASKEIRCYGNQIMITALSLEAANQWVVILRQIGRVRRPTESMDENKVNHDPRRSKSYHRVWRVWATV